MGDSDPGQKRSARFNIGVELQSDDAGPDHNAIFSDSGKAVVLAASNNNPVEAF
jgi:hypothetical protein